MTKYVLHGGLSIEDNPKNIKFYSEILKDVNSPVAILMVYFARDREKRSGLFEIQKKLFKKSNPDYKIHFLFASEDPDEFRAQAKQSQVMFIEGGSSLRLLEQLEKITDIKELIRSMDVYVGSSAGAGLVVKYTFPSSRDKIGERLGLVPIKLINHYDESKKDRLVRLKAVHPELKTYVLRECEYIVF